MWTLLLEAKKKAGGPAIVCGAGERILPAFLLTEEPRPAAPAGTAGAMIGPLPALRPPKTPPNSEKVGLPVVRPAALVLLVALEEADADAAPEAEAALAAL